MTASTMFEAAELEHTLDKERYKQEVPALREALLKAQYELLEQKNFPVLLVIGGVDGAGKGETVNLLHEWMDPRHLRAWAFDAPTDEERERPSIWRFWRNLPPKGTTGIFLGSWYTDPIIKRVYGDTDDAALDQSMDEVVRFERMLANEGALVLKLWFHLSKKQQKKRLASLERDPKTRWRVTDQDWKHFKLYDQFVPICARALAKTNTAEAPWVVVPGADPRFRSVTAGKALLDAMRKRLDAKEARPQFGTVPPLHRAIDGVHLLSKLDLSQKSKEKEYDEALDRAQRKLNLLTRKKAFRNHSVIAVFEGVDAAGKGGAIRRITGALDARSYRVIPIAAPTEEERAQPYLWRFWRHIPRRGRIALFDRSWYGRVLVERVEGYCSEHDWMRAYGELNDFELELSRHGAVVVKFWLQVSPEEQLKRFKEREKTGFKQYKITEEDWRNRKKWDAYAQAASDMIERTTMEHAPWVLIEAEDKRFARLKVLQTLTDRLENALG